MCRMLIASGNVDVNSILDGAILMAKDKNNHHELNDEQGLGSWTHPDGWGAAYIDEEGDWIIKKSTKSVYEDPLIEELRKIKTKLFILHIRKKMGSETSFHNTHPFILEKKNPGSFVFCHNGFIDEEIYFDNKFKTNGETDSEKLFYSILTDLKGNNLKKAIRKNFRRYHKLTGTNIIFSNKESSVIAIRENRFPVYYQMCIGKNEEMVVISSEKLRNLPRLEWEYLNQGDIVTLDHKKNKFKVNKQRITLKKVYQEIKEKREKYIKIPIIDIKEKACN